MARHARQSPWTRSFQRTLAALTRSTWRAGVRAAAKAVESSLKPTVRPVARQVAAEFAVTTGARPSVEPGGWLDGVAATPGGVRRYRLYRPPGAARRGPLPLLVMLHGCRQEAAGFARSARLQALAARQGFVVLCPEQERLANAQGCWNWFETRSGRAFGEAASIVAAIDQACRLHGADPLRVAVAGLSAGASMAALLAVRHPERFAAVAMHSGVAPGAAHSTATALRAMQGRRPPDPLTAPAGGLPPLLVIQGLADPVVRPANGRAAAQLWADAAGARPTASRRVQRGTRHAAVVTDFKRQGRLVATLCEVARLGHAWSGGAPGQPYSDPEGPDAARMIWAFALRQFHRVA